MELGDTYFYITSAAFLTGFVLQGAWITSQKKNRKKYLLAVLATLITYFFSNIFLRGNLTTSEPTSVIVLPMMVLLFFLVALFKDTLPRIGTQTALLYTVFFWFVWYEAYYKLVSKFLTPSLAIAATLVILTVYIIQKKTRLSLRKLLSYVFIFILATSWIANQFISDYKGSDTLGLFFFFVLLFFIAIATPIISTICIIKMAYTKIPLDFRLKLIAYIWFLLVAVSLIVSQFPSDMNSPRIKESASLIEILFKFFEVLFSGMFILQLAFYLAILVHIEPRDRETAYEWEERAQLLADSFSDLRLKPAWSLALIMAQVSVLALNSYMQIIPNRSMIALLALFSMQPVTGKENDDAMIMNDIVDRTTADEQLEAAEQKQIEADREKLKELVSKERKKIEGRN
jgi:hypothetical protein